VIDLSARSYEPEWMDTEPVSLETFRHCLQDLCRLNRWSFGYRPTLSWLQGEVRRRGLRSFRLLDVGFGYGDMLRRIERLAEAHAWDAELVGVDSNPYSKQVAEKALSSSSIRYVTGDVFDHDASEGFDFIISSLFTHHLDDRELAKFLRWQCERARLGWFANDIHRHWVPYYALSVVGPMASLNELVKHDGPLSVARAFRREDWTQMTDSMDGRGGSVRIQWYLPFRFGVSWRASA